MSLETVSSVRERNYRSAGDIWASIARRYAAFGSPLVPCRDDILAFESAVEAAAATQEERELKAVTLGVTPGLALMKWPHNSRITAIEMSQDVIDALWPGDIADRRRALCANWNAISEEVDGCDIVLGDGSLNVCRFPHEAQYLARAIGSVLEDGGLFAIRIYISAGPFESVDEVFRELFSFGMRVDLFKMRLWMAMQRTVENGVAMREAAHILHAYNLDPHVMQERIGWSREAIEPFHDWAASNAVYTFPSISEFMEVMSDTFEEVSVCWPRYELGHCCPTVIMRRK